MQDRPSAVELLEAVGRFLDREVVPALQGPGRYHARVAANVMRILARERQLAEAQLIEEWRRLGELLGEPGERPVGRDALEEEVRRRTEDLCERIRRGDADAGDWRERVLAHVRSTVEEKLAIAKPELLGRGGQV